MKKEECFYLGRVAKTHGLKGEVTLRLDVDDPSAYAKMKHFFLEINKVLTPYFIEHIKTNGDKLFVKIKDIDTIEMAQNLVGKEAYLPMEMLPKLSGKQFYFHEIVGFTVVDTEKGELGAITEVLEYPTQAILQVMKDKKEILIPILDHVIQQVDRDRKILQITAPEGLIDMYLQ